ncbi:hypothetical protein LQM11_003072 [Vibrio parahaemolyticus]|nr:hypothetical protein [Vibrio parahaemolyticus]
MQLAVLVCALSLVLVGLLFGFNIQVSDSVVAVLNSMGSILGGVGAAVAAFISYRSAGQWKKEFKYSKVYEAIWILEEIIPQMIQEIMQAFTDHELHSLGWVDTIERITNITVSNSKSYNKAFGVLSDMLPVGQRDELKKLRLSAMQSTFLASYFTVRDAKKSLDDLFGEDPDISLSDKRLEPYKANICGMDVKMLKLNEDCLHILSGFKASL